MRQALTFLKEQSEMVRERLRAGRASRCPRERRKTETGRGGTLADFCLALFNRNEFVYVR